MLLRTKYIICLFVCLGLTTKITREVKALEPFTMTWTAIKGIKNLGNIKNKLNKVIKGELSGEGYLNPCRAQMISDGIKIGKSLEYLICAYEDLEFYKKELQILGYNNCLLDFEIEAATVRVNNATWLIKGVLKPLIANEGKIMNLIMGQTSDSGNKSDCEKWKDSLKEISDAVGQLGEVEDKVKAEYEHLKRNQQAIMNTQENAAQDVRARFGFFK